MRNFGIKKRQKIGNDAVKIVEAQLKADGCKIRDTGCEKRLNKKQLFRLRYRKKAKDYLLRYRPDKLITTKNGKKIYIEVKSSSTDVSHISYTQFAWNYYHNKVYPVYYAFVNRKKGTIKYFKYNSIKLKNIYVFKCNKFRYYAEKDKKCLLIANDHHVSKFGKRKDFVKESKWSYEPRQKWFRYNGLFVRVELSSIKINSLR